MTQGLRTIPISMEENGNLFFEHVDWVSSGMVTGSTIVSDNNPCGSRKQTSRVIKDFDVSSIDRRAAVEQSEDKDISFLVGESDVLKQASTAPDHSRHVAEAYASFIVQRGLAILLQDWISGLRVALFSTLALRPTLLTGKITRMSSEKEVLVPLVYARCDKPHLDLIKIVPGTGNAEPLPWLDCHADINRLHGFRLPIILTILEPNFPLLPPAPQLRLCQLSSTPHGL